MPGRSTVVTYVAVAALALGGCGGPGPDAADLGEDVGVADGWQVAVVREDLLGPTQLVSSVDGSGALYVAELAGGEEAGTGRVRRLGPSPGPGDGPEGPPLLDGLLAPTGVVAVLDDDGRTVVLAQEPRRIVDVLVDGADAATAPTTVVDALPFNGRSQGTLTVTPDGRVLHVSTGSGGGRDPGESGRLYALRPGLDGSDVVAVGFKNAYAHAFGPDGELYVTEIGDGRYDGEVPRDALHVVTPDVYERAIRGGEPYDGGWPRCTGDGEPTEELGVTADDCAALPGPLATFPPRATPTSVAVAADGTVLVALWADGRVIEVDPVSGEVSDVLTGLDQPQHLLAVPDGSVLVTVHGTGRMLRLSPPDDGG